MSARILVIDDKENIRRLLSTHLESLGYEVDEVESGEKAVERFSDTIYEIVITDMKMPGGMDGLELLERAKEISPDTAVIVITAFADMDDAVNALKRGAADYLKKPFKLDDIQTSVEKALATRRLMTENRLLRREVEKKYNFSNIIARSEAMKKVFSTIKRVASAGSTVLITGETGTGKELVAWALHDISPRRERPFVVVNCAAIPPNLMESELFGHVLGAFTDAKSMKRGRFEDADGGTLFLDEVGELELETQAKLLRVLENGELNRVGENRTRRVDVRVLAATNTQLEDAVSRGVFRKDLFYRLNVLNVKLPLLCERRDDIPLLLRHFLDRACGENNVPLKIFSPDALNVLIQYSWPGNVRELHNLVERCVLMTDREEIGVDDLPEYVFPEAPAPAAYTAIFDESDMSLKSNVNRIVGSVEKELILAALEKSGGNKEKAAALLQISRRSLFYKLKEYGMQPPD